MLGQPVYFLTPDVVGVHLTGALRGRRHRDRSRPHVTELLRKAKVVGKFVEFFGAGRGLAAGGRPRHHRQHGARVRRDHGLLPRGRGVPPLPARRPAAAGSTCDAFGTTTRRRASSASRQGRHRLLADARARPRRLAAQRGRPKRPQDRIDLPDLKTVPRAAQNPRPRTATARPPSWRRLSRASAAGAGGGSQDRSMPQPRARRKSAWTEAEMANNHPTPDAAIPAPASATRRSRPRRRPDRRHHLLHQHLEPERHARRGAAGEEGGRARPLVSPRVKTSLAPGSRVVTDYLARPACSPTSTRSVSARRLRLHDLHRQLRPAPPGIEEAITKNDLVAAGVLSGNRNFEARIHPEHQGELPDVPAARRRLRPRRAASTST